MCDACARHVAKPAAGGHRRRRIWELNSGWHCAIVGTCLTLRDLRALGRKLNLRPQPGFPVDYQLHGHFVGAASTPARTAKLLNTLLERKHRIAIRTLGRTATPACLEAAWEAALADGDIPGPFWALMSHPDTPETLAERMFADVHMLSHLVGASNRADIRRLSDLEEELAENREALNRERRRHAERMAEKTRCIDRMSEQLARRGASGRMLGTAAPKPAPAAADPDELQALERDLKQVRAEAAEREQELSILRDDVAALLLECDEMERTLTAQHVREGVPEDADAAPIDLGGQCILYVGGRPQSVNRYRQILESWNGELLHHDGGMEKSMGELASAIARADTVVFPCDCVSHDAVCNVKKLCRQQMKSFVPLRTSGLASLVAALGGGRLDAAAAAPSSIAAE